MDQEGRIMDQDHVGENGPGGEDHGTGQGSAQYKSDFVRIKVLLP